MLGSFAVYLFAGFYGLAIGAAVVLGLHQGLGS